jgi:hypothetical protein
VVETGIRRTHARRFRGGWQSCHLDPVREVEHMATQGGLVPFGMVLAQIKL